MRHVAHVRIWNPSRAKLLHVLSGHEANPTAVVFHPKGKRLVTGDAAGTFKVWDAKSGEEIASFTTGASGRIAALCFSPDGERLAAAGLVGGITIVEIEDLL